MDRSGSAYRAAGPGLGLGQLREGVFRSFVTPNFDGSKVSVYDMMFDGDGSLWVASTGKGASSASAGMLWSTTDEQKAYPAMR